MALYGEKDISIDALKRWVDTISIDDIDEVEIGGNDFKIQDTTKNILELQVKMFVDLVRAMKPGDDWREFLHCLSGMAYNAIFKVKNGAIRVANFYEGLIKPGNSKTYKKIIQGHDYLTIGSVEIFDGDKLIATIGQKSDLIWHVFFEYFINSNEYGEVVHTHSNHEKYLSIQLFDVENKTQFEIDHIINEILLRISVEHGLDFKLVELDINYKSEGEANTYDLQFHEVEYEYIPTLYFNNGVHSNDVRLSYLSFYQVIELEKYCRNTRHH